MRHVRIDHHKYNNDTLYPGFRINPGLESPWLDKLRLISVVADICPTFYHNITGLTKLQELLATDILQLNSLLVRKLRHLKLSTDKMT